MADNDKDKSVKVEAPKEKDERRKIHMYIKVGLLSSRDCDQEIINMNRNGNSANFFSYVCNGKKCKELSVSTLNGIPASVRCVSSMIVVINGKLASLLAGHANKNDGEKRRSPTRVPCFAS